MTDNDDQSSKFSFRMFDLYRRFVEVLQLNKDYLKDFKTGEPKVEICREIIKKVFQCRQSEEKIIPMIKYLNKNAIVIANHAENIPENWNEAIKYTDKCIKDIRKYLRAKGINIKNELDSIKELAKDIGEHLHKIPNERQIEAIREYLKYDLRNPKRTIIPHKTCKRSKSKSKKSSKTEKSENTDATEVKKCNLQKIIKKLSNESSEIKTDQKVKDDLSQSKDDEKVQNESQTNENDGESQEELLTAEIQKLLHQANAKSQNELLHIEDTKSSLEDLSQKEDLKKCGCSPEDEYIIVEYEPPGIKVPKTNEESSESTSVIESSSNYRLKLKRQSDGSFACNCAKKLATSTMLNVQDDQFITITYDNNKKNSENKTSQLPSLSTTGSESLNQIDEDTTEINIYDDEIDFETNLNLQNFKKSQETEILEPLLKDVKVELNKEENVPHKFENKLLNQEDNYCPKDEIKYSNVVNMTYTEALKLVETIMAFCELRNEISLEEFLVLRRTRDKMQWKSLKEAKKMESPDTNSFNDL